MGDLTTVRMRDLRPQDIARLGSVFETVESVREADDGWLHVYVEENGGEAPYVVRSHHLVDVSDRI